MNLIAIQLLMVHAKIEITIEYLGVEIAGALKISVSCDTSGVHFNGYRI